MYVCIYVHVYVSGNLLLATMEMYYEHIMHLSVYFVCVCVQMMYVHLHPYTHTHTHIHTHVRPFWLSPRQAVIVPVSSKYDAYAEEVRVDVTWFASSAAHWGWHLVVVNAIKLNTCNANTRSHYISSPSSSLF